MICQQVCGPLRVGTNLFGVVIGEQMMARFRATWTALSFGLIIGLGLTTSSARAAGGSGLLTESMAEQVGLQVLWVGALPQSISEGRRPLVRYHLYTGETDKFYDVMVDGRRVMSYSPAQLGRNGIALGEEGIKRQFEFERMRLERRGKKATLEVVNVPKSRLYSLGTDGGLVSLDGETGKVIWSAQVGNAGAPPLGLDANNNYVTTIRGARLYLFDTAEGKPLADEWVEGAPVYGPMIGGDYIFVWTANGGIEGYQTANIFGQPYRERATGGLIASPVRTPSGDRFGWPTDRGYLYVLEAQGQPRLPFRIEPPEPVTSSIATAPGGRVVCVSQSGTVYCAWSSNIGRMAWRRLIGEIVNDPPVVVNNTVFIRAVTGTTYALSLDTGIPIWKSPLYGIGRIVGGDGDDAVFMLTSSDDFLRVSTKTGEVQARVRLSARITSLPHNISDRMYVMGRSGEIQCLAPRGKVRPTPIYALAEAAIASQAAGGTPAVAKPAEPADAEANPFGAPATEAMAPAADAPAGGDPFSSPSDPFGAAPGAGAGGAAAGGNDPFGAADPFAPKP